MINHVRDLLLCKDNFNHFAEHHLKYTGRSDVHFYQPQKYLDRLLEMYENNRFIIAKKFRQGGFSTFNVFYGLWKCFHNFNQKFLYLSISDYPSRYIAGIAKTAYGHMPKEIYKAEISNDGREIVFPVTDSVMRFTTHSGACGTAATHLFIDEAAYVDNMEMWWKAYYPTLSLGGKAFVISTPNGKKGWFFKTFFDAYYNGLHGIATMTPWRTYSAIHYEREEYKNPKWVENMRSMLGEHFFQQEYQAIFV